MSGYGVEMTADEIAALLYDHGTGVLSLSREGRSYGIPISYGYDGDRNRCVLDLGFGPESRKETFLGTTERGCLTVYEWHSPTDWQSAVVTGELNELGEELTHDAEELYYEYASDVEISVFGLPPEEVALEWYALDIEEASGRSSRR